MTARERQRVRELVDAAVRARVAAENEQLDVCSGCGMPRSDWTPGCKVCWCRHRNWSSGRTACPYVLDPTLRSRVRVFIEGLRVDMSRASIGSVRSW